MGLFDGILGGIVGAEMATVVGHVIQQHGGVQGLLTHLQSQGLGSTAQSWVSNGPNQPISAAQVHTALGPDLMTQLAAKMGVTPQELSTKLAQVMPGAIDKLTPNGSVPTMP